MYKFYFCIGYKTSLRCNNIELQNIPDTVPLNALEEHVLEILKSIDIPLVSYDIVAVHCICKQSGGKPRNVIVCFNNRNNAYKYIDFAKKTIEIA